MATNLPAEHHYFYEDVVYRVDKRGNVVFGIVMENNDLDSSDEVSVSEESPKRKKGEIRVVWHPSGVEELVNSKKVRLADRTLMPGDVVRRMIKGKDTQRGYCRDIELTACVQVIGTKQVLTDIKSEDLVPLEEFATDIAVCLNSWVGGINMVHFKLWLATPDGSRCVVNEKDARILEQFEEKHDNDKDFPHSSEFYPGQSLWGPVHCLEDAVWIQCTKEMKAKRKTKPQKIVKVVVEKVETDWVTVNWQCRAYSKDGAWSDQVHPNFVVRGEDLEKLKLLNVFEPSTLQVGDRNFYVIKGNENVITREQWCKQQREIFQVPKQSPRKTRVRINVTKPSEEKNKDKAKQKGTETEKPVTDRKDVNTQSNVNGSQIVGSNNTLMPPQQNQNADSSDDWDTEDTGSQSDEPSSVSSGCSSVTSMGKKKKGPALMTKVLKKKKLCKAKAKAAPVELVPGSKIVVETLSTSTKANVVWQDGSVELGIPSTQLYPIHHLDDKEFFPGDFVVDQKEESRMYGVVQSVDHRGRTAKIKWFRTYTSSQSPQPTLLEEREVSVYDLKDHPDFQYRPGTLVIRIANFEGEDADCTAGQVLDNYPEGRVKVWWVDGHVSMCWPQDLYKVGNYDSDEGELWDDVSSDTSWETEREDCIIADTEDLEQTESIKPKLAAHIEKARIGMSRLEEIFTQNPSLQTTEVMRRLLEVYKDCRRMDKLMGTSFFHESHFQGLLERVRERGRANVAQRMAAQVSRLFTQESEQPQPQEADAELENAENANAIQNANNALETIATKISDTVEAADNANRKMDPGRRSTKEEAEVIDRLFINMNRNPEDSGLFSAENSKKESGSSESSGEFPLSEDAINLADRSPAPEPADVEKPEEDEEEAEEDDDEEEEGQGRNSSDSRLRERTHVAGSTHVCAKLCTLIKAQLVLAHAEASKRFGLSKMSLSDAAKSASPAKRQKKEEPPVEPPSEPSEPPVEVPPPVYAEGEGFSIEETAPDSHKFKLTMFQPTDPANFFRTVSKELKLLRNSLPPGVWVKGFEDRIDLYSVMLRGPEKTPYEDGLFLFDFQLSADYPAAPPLCHYICYCSDRLNPNLYEDGKVCVSLLGTWSGRGTEVWTSSSTLLQVIVSIQGLILVSEPYFNEAGFEKQKGSQQGRENSRMYNEMVVLKLVQAQTKLILHPPPIFKDTIVTHFERHAEKLLERLDLWMEISERHNDQHPLSPVTPTTFKEIAHCGQSTGSPQVEFPLDRTLVADEKILPEFPLIPASRGFCITLRKTLATFKQVLVKEGIIEGTIEGAIEGTTEGATEGTTSEVAEQASGQSKDLEARQESSETRKDTSDRNTS
ncbi:(E3-independent) E2 ubiquitin-conjugating enzyme UBE2O [Orussus abietinus]|uniref:(E3-independent) E2 ubiquitin-conjugating enzyme UBE2O n=1 Tax=Orussus abietinus TaxID=222816 RepID=UPI00062563B7|nr:(E3-independent) E2 ubiquitin-conjugating enzyme UBE2O [Orussus abietinus]